VGPGEQAAGPGHHQGSAVQEIPKNKPPTEPPNCRLGDTPKYRLFECDTCLVLKWIASRSREGHDGGTPGSQSRLPRNCARQRAPALGLSRKTPRRGILDTRLCVQSRSAGLPEPTMSLPCRHLRPPPIRVCLGSDFGFRYGRRESMCGHSRRSGSLTIP
jgi:hypothetical protein